MRSPAFSCQPLKPAPRRTGILPPQFYSQISLKSFGFQLKLAVLTLVEPTESNINHLFLVRDSDVTLLSLPRELVPDPDMPPKPKPSLSDQRQDLVLRRTGEPPLVLPLMWFSLCYNTALSVYGETRHW